MPIVFNGSEIERLVFNGLDLDSCEFNGSEVFSSVEVAPWITFVASYRTANIQEDRSWIYRINYDTITATSAYNTPAGTKIESIERDPDTGAYYSVEKTTLSTPTLAARFDVKKSVNGSPPWTTVFTITNNAFELVSIGRVLIRGNNIIEFYYTYAFDPSTVRCYRSVNGGTSWNSKWISPSLFEGIPSDMVQGPNPADTIVVSSTSANGAKCRLLDGNGNITQTIIGAEGTVFRFAFWHETHERIYLSRDQASSSTYELISTNRDFGNLTTHDTANAYVQAAPTASTERKLYYGNVYNLRSYDTQNVEHEEALAFAAFGTLAKGRNIVVGGAGINPLKLKVSYNRGLNWRDINLPNHVPNATFSEVSIVKY